MVMSSKYSKALLLGALAALPPAIFFVAANFWPDYGFMQPNDFYLGSDFVNYWMGGRLALLGRLDALYDVAAAVVAGGELLYLEDVASRVADGALALGHVARVRVAVRKPHVALPGPLEHAGVVLERDRMRIEQKTQSPTLPDPTAEQRWLSMGRPGLARADASDGARPA